jgi:aspartate racemase
MKTVGIIGGVGPETTAQFYRSLISTAQNLDKTTRPPILIYSVPLPYAIERDSILNATGEKRNIPYLVEAAKILEKGGADFLVMPCNTLHAFIGDIRSGVKIPVLSIIEETTNFLKTHNISNVGLISTASTRKNKLYENAFTQASINYEVPTDSQQEQIGHLIHNLVMGDVAENDKEQLESIIASFEAKNIQNIILACTDLQLLNPKHVKFKIYDTMKILADATIREILKD